MVYQKIMHYQSNFKKKKEKKKKRERTITNMR